MAISRRPCALRGGPPRAMGVRAATVRGAEVVVSAAPSHAVRDVMLRAAPTVARGAVVVSVSKGLEPERLSTMSCVLREVLPKGAQIAVLSGPSFAQEVYAGQPTAVVAAAEQHAVAQRVQQVFSTGYFRVYSATDVVGVELGGGKRLEEALAGRATVAEGVSTARSAVALGARHEVELPIAREVSEVLFQGKPPRQAVSDLMERDLKPEHWR